VASYSHTIRIGVNGITKTDTRNVETLHGTGPNPAPFVQQRSMSSIIQSLGVCFLAFCRCPTQLLFLIPLTRPHLFYDLFEIIFPLSRNYHHGSCNCGTMLACTVKFCCPKKVTVRRIDALQFKLMRLSTIMKLPA